MTTKGDDTESNQPSDASAEVDQPGLSRLREVVANYARRQLPIGPNLRQDGIAGLNSAIGAVPDGMADGLLAGVHPIHGLYGSIFGPLLGGIFSSTRLMVVTTTSASALAAGQVLAGFPIETRTSVFFTMVILIGAFQVLFSAMKVGWLMNFVSYSVMTGFLTGIAVLLVLSQLPTVAGFKATGHNTAAKAFDLLAHLDKVNISALGIGALTMILALVLPRTRLGNLGTFVAIVISSLLAVVLGVKGVQTVHDIREIPRGFPPLSIPAFSGITMEMVTGALAVALVVVVQAAGISQSVRNPDGSRSSMARDCAAQGVANIASGLFRGLPVGGSLNATALNVVSGARTRWATIFMGLWLAVIVLAFPGVVSHIAMPSLGALLILAGAHAVKPADVLAVWNTGWPSRIAAVVTFLSTLLLPIHVAIGIGVALSTLLYLSRSSTDISLVALVKRADGQVEEHKAPKHLQSNQVTVLNVYGHLFYAGARTLERLLPAIAGAQNPVVILRLRGRATLGATLLEVLSDYVDKLKAVNGRLYLTGVSERALEQITRAGKLRLGRPVRAYEMTPIIWQSTHEAYSDAHAWLVSRNTDAQP